MAKRRSARARRPRAALCRRTTASCASARDRRAIAPRSADCRRSEEWQANRRYARGAIERVIACMRQMRLMLRWNKRRITRPLAAPCNLAAARLAQSNCFIASRPRCIACKKRAAL
eukprot:scaffold244126_cov30-Tisochrysis_lutea.AAC.6